MFYRFLKNRWLRGGIVFLRMAYFIKLRKKISSLEGDPEFVSPNTLSSNRRRVVADETLPPHPTARTLFGLDLDIFGNKSKKFIEFCQLRYGGHFHNKKILIIGPRNEAEIFNFMAHGFKRENIHSIDLFSYSPMVKIMDMHNLAFEDASFDLVYAGWVISYSDNRLRALQEMMRVAKPNGVIGVTATLSEVSNEDLIGKRGYMVGSTDRLHSLADLTEIFSSLAGEGYLTNATPIDDIPGTKGGLVCFCKAISH